MWLSQDHSVFVLLLFGSADRWVCRPLPQGMCAVFSLGIALRGMWSEVVIVLLSLSVRRHAQVSAVPHRTGMEHTSADIYIHLTQTAPKGQAPGRLPVWGRWPFRRQKAENECHFGNASIHGVFVSVLFCDPER